MHGKGSIKMNGRVLIDRYEIIELIGRGGMAYVYKGRDLKLNRFVAIKVLRSEYAENEQFIKKFDRESQAAAGLSHPNIVSVYDVGVDQGTYFIVMEYVNGITLKQYLEQKGCLEYHEATNFIIDVAEALKCAHENKIIHRDIKPHNIMLTRDLIPKVTDFGIARAITRSTVTLTNQTMGSVHYISPEQARGGFVDERSDLYSMGIMFYELVTGELPFDEENSVTIAIKHIREDIVPPQELNPRVPDSVNNVILKLTQKDPEARYQSMDELIDDLDRLMIDATANVGSMNHQYIDDQPFNRVYDENSLFRVEQGTTVQPIIDDDFGMKNDEEKKRKRIILISAIAGAVFLLIIGTVLAMGMNKKVMVEVPQITNMTKSEATIALENVGLILEVEKEVFSTEIEAGKIATQNPKEKTQTEKGKIVKASISKGAEEVAVPELVGITENQAIAAIESAGLSVGEILREYNKDYDAGVVFDASSKQGEKLPTKTKVTLHVSKGIDLVHVPGIIGLTVDDANARIQNNGFMVGTSSSEYSDSYSAGVVMRQSLGEGTEAERGTSINYVISLGSKPAPTPTPEPEPKPDPKPDPKPEN